MVREDYHFEHREKTFWGVIQFSGAVAMHVHSVRVLQDRNPCLTFIATERNQCRIVRRKVRF